MTDVAADNQRFLEKHILGFFRSDLMTLPIFLYVGFIPVKTDAIGERVSSFRHDLQYTFNIYIE